jgi:uncharacterized repeat protein (TIGR03803 family)
MDSARDPAAHRLRGRITALHGIKTVQGRSGHGSPASLKAPSRNHMSNSTGSLHYVHVTRPLFPAVLLLLLASCGGSDAQGPAPTYTVGANVSGLSGKGLVLQLSGGATLAVTANGPATFATSLVSGKSYQVTVQTQPSSPQQVCSVANGSGTIATSNVTVNLTCVTSGYTVGVTVQGLSGSGLVLQLNAGSNLPITANGQATFAAPVALGASYAISVQTQPSSPAQTCVLTRAVGTITNHNVNNASVSCITVLTGGGAPTVSTLYSFTGSVTGSSDGSGPTGSLVQGSGDGNLYGATFSGGGTEMLGTVFKITPAGHETVLYALGTSGFDLPGICGGLTQGSDGNFYGVTVGSFGGPYAGEVFQVTPAGAETTIRQLYGADTGDNAYACGLTELSDGYLYGWGLVPYQVEQGPGLATLLNVTYPTQARVTSSYILKATDGSLYITQQADVTTGVVLKVVAGTATPFYSFGRVPDDAGPPGAPLIEGTDGNLYGTSATGGSPSAACPNGCGTVFRITPAGVETVLHSFGGNAADGQAPSGALVQGTDGNFYGLTSAGGNTPTGSATPNCNCGTIFRITPAGEETVLYSFGTGANDGKQPSGALLQASDGNFYGTTGSGGPSNDGTVFKLVVGAN